VKDIDKEPFFIKEIKEQPKVLANTLTQYLGPNRHLKMTRPPLDDQTLRKVRQVYITACGTSFHAGMTARYIFEELTQLPTVVEPASEAGRHHLLIDENTLAVAISQSGRSQDTLAALNLAKSRGAVTLGLVNESPSPLTESALGSIMTLAGQVFTLSSTKAFTSQTLVLGLLAVRLAQSRGLMKEKWPRDLESLGRIPELVRYVLTLEDKVVHMAKALASYDHVFILARGALLPMAYEGALKLKEVAHFHAEGYSAGEFGHGPLAMVGSHTPIILIAFSGEADQSNLALIRAFRARGAPVWLISEDGPKKDLAMAAMSEVFFPLPAVQPRLRPIVAIIPLQLLAYHLGRLRMVDVDSPGGLLGGEDLVKPAFSP
jgi:glucosamine--fructose-6-phosphate aminotransferase (isomerizing)